MHPLSKNRKPNPIEIPPANMACSVFHGGILQIGGHLKVRSPPFALEKTPAMATSLLGQASTKSQVQEDPCWQISGKGWVLHMPVIPPPPEI